MSKENREALMREEFEKLAAEIWFMSTRRDPANGRYSHIMQGRWEGYEAATQAQAEQIAAVIKRADYLTEQCNIVNTKAENMRDENSTLIIAAKAVLVDIAVHGEINTDAKSISKLGQVVDAIRKTPSTNTQSQASQDEVKIARLLNIIGKYAYHTLDCQRGFGKSTAGLLNCTCGYSELPTDTTTYLADLKAKVRAEQREIDFEAVDAVRKMFAAKYQENIDSDCADMGNEYTNVDFKKLEAAVLVVNAIRKGEKKDE